MLTNNPAFTPELSWWLVTLIRDLPLFWIQLTSLTIIFLVVWIGYRAVSYGTMAMLIVYLEIFLLAFVLAMYSFLSYRVTELTGYPPF